MPALYHFSIIPAFGLHIESELKNFTPLFRTKGGKVQDLRLVIACALLSQRERERSEMSYSFNVTGKRAQGGVSF